MHLIPLCELVQKGKVESPQNKKPTKESFYVVYTLLLFCHWALWRMVGDESTVGQLTLSKWKFSEEWLHDLGNWDQKSPQTDIWISPTSVYSDSTRTIANLFGNDLQLRWPLPLASPMEILVLFQYPTLAGASLQSMAGQPTKPPLPGDSGLIKGLLTIAFP